MEIGLTKMSSKGQIVIPQYMRAGFEVGAKIFLLKNKDQLILKSEHDLAENFVEDIEFAKRTEEAYRDIEAGNFMELDSENLEEMMKW